MFGRSVSFRLILLSTAWIVAALVVGGVVLSQHFRTHVETAFDKSLVGHIEELLSFAEVVDGKLGMRRHPSDPEYIRPLSGWYWEIVVNAETIDRSRSLWDEELHIETMPVPARGEVISFAALGPRGNGLRVVAETFTLPGFEHEVTIYVTGAASAIEQSMEEFTETLTLSLLMLGAGLVFAVLVQVILGLRPLKLMRSRLGDIHAGRADRMVGTYPSEIEPLVNDLNLLLENNAAVIKRARTHAGNLAHALKTPLAVLQNETDTLPEDQRTLIRDQTGIMNEMITRHLSRARAAGGVGVPGLNADLGEIASILKRTLTKIYGDRNITIALVDVRDLCVVGDFQDLEEILGNLMDNACKWAETRVRITGAREGGFATLLVEDDGPGVPDDKLDEIMGRGKRLDEATPGSGLGLNIVLELVELYQGSLTLGRSELGGLSVRLQLPLS